MAETLGGRSRFNCITLAHALQAPGESSPNSFYGVSDDPNGNFEGALGDRAFLLGGNTMWICQGGTVWLDATSLPPTAPGQNSGFVATFDPSGIVGQRTVGNHLLGVFLPENVVVTNLFYRIVTDATSAANTATIAFGIMIDDADGLVTGIAINDAVAPWTAGPNPIRPRTGDIADIASQGLASVPTTGVRQLQCAVGVQPLLTGKIEFYGQYTILAS